MTQPFPPPRWTAAEFSTDAETAITEFRDKRIQEPLEQYLEAFDAYRDAVENLIEGTVDLAQLSEQAVQLLTDPNLLVAVRYLASPAISEDDLKVLAEAVLSPARLNADPVMARRVVDTVLLGLDRHRFPWVAEDREPTDAERETAVISTVSLMATQKVQTLRRTQSKTNQEAAVTDRLLAEGFTQVPTRFIRNFGHAPAAGEFCQESMFGSRKADLIVGLWDGRKLPLECKVSNSSTNSVKRLNNDAAIKAETWLKEFGTQSVVPAAVISGVFKLGNLVSAQSAGLTIFWAHNLDALAEFIDAARP